MLNPIKEIFSFNKKAGLLDTEFNDTKESEFIIEEALEGFDCTALCEQLNININSTPKEISRAIVTGYCIVPRGGLKDVDRLDKFLDIIVFSFGAIFKLRLSVQEALRSLGVVMKANMTKLSVGKDEHGKQMKPANFVGPEEELQTILDGRKVA